jgi:hypothetical protein
LKHSLGDGVCKIIQTEISCTRHCELPLRRIGCLEDYPTRNARANLDVVDGAVAKGIQHGKEPPDLFADDEIAQVQFRSRSLISIELEVVENLRRRAKNRFTIMHFQAPNRSKMEPLASPDQCLA